MTEYHSIKDEVLEKLERSLPTLQEKFGVATIGIFGSVSRGEDTKESDIDILYTFRDGETTLTHLIELTEYLEELFGRKVDLVSDKWMNPVLRPYILKDVICCAGEMKGTT